MATKVAISGFGRIGRNVMRAFAESGRSDLEVVAINDIAPIEQLAHLFRYDSAHGVFKETVAVDGDTLTIGSAKVKVLAERNPADLPWGDMAIDMRLRFVGIREDAGALHHNIDG
ncbi:MAG: glyceraldehyde 3-phosphate dehydrogenase NAD-binding domain-containing protein, partial [Pseudomonadota bacterium]